MSTKSTLSASGLSFALGVGNTFSLSTLTSSVEELKASMSPPTNNTQNKTVSLFGSKSRLGSKGRLGTILSSGNPEIDALSVRVVDLNDEMTIIKGRGTDAATYKADIDGIASSLESLDKSMDDTNFDIEQLVSIAPSTVEFANTWTTFGTNAYVDEIDSTLILKDCNIGLTKNRGAKSAIHFSGLDDPNWSMYTSAPIGTSTDEGSPPKHSGVTGTAARMRIGDGSSDGVVIETSTKDLLFVGSDGKTHIMSTVSGDLGSGGDVSGFSHKDFYNGIGFAVSQSSTGSTRVNSAGGFNLKLNNKDIPVVTVAASDDHTMIVKNNNGGNTLFNSNGKNTISSSKRTILRSGVSDTDLLMIDNKGVSMDGTLYIDDISVNEMIRTLMFRLEVAEKASGITS